MPIISATLLVSLLAPTVLTLFGVGFTWLWLFDRRRIHLIPAAAACFIYVLGAAIQISRFPFDFGVNLAISASAYALAVSLMCQAALLRSQRAWPWFVPIGAALAAAAFMFWFSYMSPSLTVRIYALNFGMGIVVLCAAWRGRQLAQGSATDRLLFWTMLAFGLHFFPRTILATAVGIPAAISAGGVPYFWTALQVALVIFGGAFAMAIVVATASDTIEEARRDRDLDALTGLLNRRGFLEMAQLHVGSAQQRPVSLIFGDIDHFKAINDTLGHAAGDTVLRAIGEAIRNHLRFDDLGARLGGEEFAVLLVGADRTAALAVAERLRKRIELLAEESLPPVTVSFGVAQHQPGEALSQLLERADRLLYAAKAGGRNRSVVEHVMHRPQLVASAQEQSDRPAAAV